MKLAVGFFDGVHLGHRRILGGADAALTFRNHPSTILSCKCLVALEARSQQRLVWAACPEPSPIVLISQPQNHVPRAHDAWAVCPSPPLCIQPLCWHLEPFTLTQK